MDETQRLISEIDDFLAKSGMAPTTFGQKAIGNWQIVRHLKAGGDTGLKTAARIRDFIRQHSDVRAA